MHKITQEGRGISCRTPQLSVKRFSCKSSLFSAYRFCLLVGLKGPTNLSWFWETGNTLQKGF